MAEQDFSKIRKRAIVILIISTLISAICSFIWNYWWVHIWTALSAILLIRRIFKKTPTEDKGNYVFGNTLGAGMSKVPVKLIYEMQMMAFSFLILGVIASTVYFIFYADIDTALKWIIGINGFFGIVLLFASLVTTFQQYKVVSLATGLNSIVDLFNSNDIPMKGGTEDGKE